MTQALTDLADLLAIDQVDESTFDAWPMRYELPRVFGGQVAGLAVAVASRTVDPDAEVHSLQCQFLRAGRADEQIRFVVQRSRDGRSFATRAVDAYQSGKLIFSARLSFHRRENGFEHQLPAPAAPGPEQLPSVSDLYHAEPGQWPPFYLEWEPLDIRVVPQDVIPAIATTSGQASRVQVWMRSSRDLGPEQSTHQALLACVADLFILSASILPHGVPSSHPGIQMASLDHCVWFHRPFRLDDWLLYDHVSPTASGGLGTCRGEFYDTDGRHVASVVQEGLIRPAG